MAALRRCVTVVVVVVAMVLIYGSLRRSPDTQLPSAFPMTNTTALDLTLTVYTGRLNLLKARCKQFEAKRSAMTQVSDNRLLFHRQRRLAYCNVPKVGSSFWFATFAILEGGITKIQSPENVTLYLEDVQSNVRVRFLQRTNPRSLFLERTTMFLFVRNPFHRLLSAYIDKFLSPNLYYWNSFGRQIIADYRPHASAISRECGHDVTFPEFLKFVAESTTVDPHWTPIYDLCSPCDYPYDFIGKSETFEEDTKQLLIRANLSNRIQYNSDGDKQVKTYMETKINQFLHHYPKAKKCITFQNLIDRLWDSFRLKGYIKEEDIPPGSITFSNNFHEISASLLNAAFSAYTSTGVKRHSSDVSPVFLKQHYTSVPAGTLENIRKKFLTDFVLFDYDLEPDFVRTDGGLKLFGVIGLVCLVILFLYYWLQTRTIPPLSI